MKTTRKYGKEADLALSLWVKLARAFSVFDGATVKSIAGFGLTQPQFGVLECLGHLGAMPIGQLCKKMLVSGGNMTVVVDNLERDGFVERVHSKEDRRTILVKLTPEGQKMFDAIFRHHADYVTELASVLSGREQLQLSVLLKKLGRGIQEKQCLKMKENS